jgi:mevalonate kinase
MPAFTSAAPGKIILFGEHSVVYGRPAIAVPVEQVRARANIIPNLRGESGDVLMQAPDIGLEAQLSSLPDEHPLAKAVWNVIHELGVFRLPACTIRITSTIPVASGMGSGAAVSVAVMRALSAFLGASLPDGIISELAYDVEKIHHGTPSGIDNTVVTYAKPVYYVRGEPIEIMELAQSFLILIANTGIYSPTSVTVGDVRQGWHSNPEFYEQLFDQMGQIAVAARFILQSGDPWKLGDLMNDNHSLLQRLDVSCPELDHLVNAALDAGAIGAKLSGGGRGGNMIALVEQGSARQISEMLLSQGAVGTIITTV